MASVLLPTKDRNIAGAQLVPGAVLQAVEWFELERDIEVKWSNGLSRWGAHRQRDGRHVITLSTYNPPAELGRTLWHELAHCAQAEREPDFGVKYRKARALYGYQRCPYEVDAREHEAMNDELPLAR